MRLMSANLSMRILSVKTYYAVGGTAGERHARLLRQMKRQDCRRRDGDEMSDAELDAFLHQLEAAAAGHGDEARLLVEPFAGHRPQQFVERIVAADILAHEPDLTL